MDKDIKVEACNDRVLIHIDGAIMGLSFHDASNLCMGILDVLRHKECSTKRFKRRATEEERKAKAQAKIRELQERYHITPKKQSNDNKQ